MQYSTKLQAFYIVHSWCIEAVFCYDRILLLTCLGPFLCFSNPIVAARMRKCSMRNRYRPTGRKEGRLRCASGLRKTLLNIEYYNIFFIKWSFNRFLWNIFQWKVNILYIKFIMIWLHIRNICENTWQWRKYLSRREVLARDSSSPKQLNVINRAS